MHTYCGMLNCDSLMSSSESVGVTWYDKRDLTGVFKLRILRWGDYSSLSGWAWCNHKGPYKKDTGEVSQRESNVITEAKSRVMWPQAYEQQQSLIARGKKEWIPQEIPEGTRPVGIFIFFPMNFISDFWHKNYESGNLFSLY